MCIAVASTVGTALLGRQELVWWRNQAMGPRVALEIDVPSVAQVAMLEVRPAKLMLEALRGRIMGRRVV